ncbi:MAG: hypothetical protein ACPG4T_23360, partial [Nannocystaceae bacterium]
MQPTVDVLPWLKSRLLGAIALALPTGCSDHSTGVTTADVTTQAETTTGTSDTEESTGTSTSSTSFEEPDTTGPDPCDGTPGRCDRCLDHSGFSCGGIFDEFSWRIEDNVSSCPACDSSCQQEAEEHYLDNNPIPDRGCPPCTPYFSLICQPSVPDEHGRCSYIFNVGLSCIGGRPLRSGRSAALLAELANGTEAASWFRATVLMHKNSIPRDIRTRIVEHWTQVARAEHASVASFARVLLSLIHLGAPRALIQETQIAIADEIRHAQIAFGIASDLSETTLGPGRLKLTPEVTSPQEPNEFASSTFLDGCIAETVAAME